MLTLLGLNLALAHLLLSDPILPWCVLITAGTVKIVGIHGDRFNSFCITRWTRAGQEQNATVGIWKVTHTCGDLVTVLRVTENLGLVDGRRGSWDKSLKGCDLSQPCHQKLSSHLLHTFHNVSLISGTKAIQPPAMDQKAHLKCKPNTSSFFLLNHLPQEQQQKCSHTADEPKCKHKIYLCTHNLMIILSNIVNIFLYETVSKYRVFHRYQVLRYHTAFKSFRSWDFFILISGCRSSTWSILVL